MSNSAPKAAGQSSAQSYAPPPPVAAYQPRSQQSYGNVGSSKGTSQPAYGGTGYNTPRLPQMVQPQYGNYNVNPTINRAAPGTVYGGPSPMAYPNSPAPIPGNVYGGPSPTVATPPPENYTAAPVINRAPIVEAPPPPPTPPPPPDQAPVAAQEDAPNPYAPVRQDEKGSLYNSQGQQIWYDENTSSYQIVPQNEKRGGRIEGKNSTDTVSRALSLVRGVVKKDKK